jgi:hypothetical protein
MAVKGEVNEAPGERCCGDSSRRDNNGVVTVGSA